MVNSWGIVNDVELLPEDERFELMLTPFPNGPNGEPAVWGGVHGLAVTKQGDSPERTQLVMDLGKHLTSFEALQDVRAWSKPARASLLEAQQADPDYAFKDFLPMFEAYTKQAIPLMGQGPNVVPVLVKYEPLVEAMFTREPDARGGVEPVRVGGERDPVGSVGSGYRVPGVDDVRDPRTHGARQRHVDVEVG